VSRTRRDVRRIVPSQVESDRLIDAAGAFQADRSNGRAYPSLVDPDGRGLADDQPRPSSPLGAPRKGIVACIVVHRDRVALFRRSDAVGSDRGRWHCITGYLEPGIPPTMQARREVEEEAGLRADDLIRLEQMAPLTLADTEATWEIHPFVFVVKTDSLRLNWENSEHSWVAPEDIDLGTCVWWLREVIAATGVGALVRTPRTRGSDPRRLRQVPRASS
jgi:8-oxo-dGTP diphosphatase